MAQQDTVYDQDADENPIHRSVNDTDLNALTGIGADEEAAMDREAHNGAAQDIANREGLVGGEPGRNSDAVSSSNLMAAESAVTDKLGAGFNASPEVAASRRVVAAVLAAKNRKAVLGGGIGGLIGLIVFFLFVFVSGPFEFIHLAHILEKAHFGSQEDAANDRFTKAVRYIRYAPDNEIYRTRLSVIGNRIADRTEAKLNSVGLKSEYRGFKISSTKDGYAIDRNAPEYKNKSAAQIKEEFKSNYGITVTDSEKGGLRIDKSELKFFSSRKFTRATLQNMGENKVSSYIQAHVMGERDGVTWHPMKKLDNKILGSVDEWWARRNKTIKNGEPEPVTTDKSTKDDAKDPAGKQANDNATNAKDNADTTVKEGQGAAKGAASGDSGALSGFADSIHGKVALGGAALAGVACLLQGVAKHADTIKEAQVVLPLARIGVEAMAVGGQGQSGIDASAEQLGKYHSLLYDPNTKTSWASARSIQAETGAPMNGPDADKTLKTISNGSPFDFLLVGAIGSALNGVCSTAGQGVIIVISFLGGPVSALAGLIGSALVGPPIEDAAAHWLAGDAVDPLAKGAKYGYNASYGALIAADHQAVSRGGIELSSGDSSSLHTFENNANMQDFQQHSFAYRLFNPVDEHSLVARIMDQQDPQVGQNVSNIASSFLNLGHSLANLPNLLFTPLTHAASASGTYDYGLPVYGFSQAELDMPTLDNPFANGEEAARILDTPCTKVVIVDGKKTEVPNHPCGADYRDGAHKCFGVDFTSTPQPYKTPVPDGEGGFITTYNQWDTKNGPKPANIFSTKDYKSLHCQTPDGNGYPLSPDDWRILRFFIFDTGVVKSEACVQGDDTSCNDVGFTATGNGSSE